MTCLLLARRASANLGANRPASSYRDLQEAEKIPTKSDCVQDVQKEIVYHKAKAAYRMGLWRHADMLAQHAFDTGTRKASAILNKLDVRLEEGLGNYDWNALFDRYVAGRRLDVANYVGPVRVVRVPGKHRSLVLTSDVYAGTLLLVEKALIHASRSERSSSQPSRLDPVSGDVKEDARVIATRKAVQLLIDEPRLKKIWDTLFPSVNPESAVLELSETERLEALHEPVSLDMHSICTKLAINSFGLSPITAKGFHSPPMRKDGEVDKDTAIWPTVSMMNHSCLPNTVHVAWGDVAVVRALYDMSAGTELTISYFSRDQPYETRAAKAKQYLFTCDCNLCAADRMDESIRRGKLMEKFDMAKQASRNILLSPRWAPGWMDRNKRFRKEMEMFRMEIERTYAPGRLIRLELARVLRLMSEHYNDTTDHRNVADINKAIELEIEALECSGAVVSTPEQSAIHGRTIERLGPQTDEQIMATLRIMGMHASLAMSVPSPVSETGQEFLQVDETPMNENEERSHHWYDTACWIHELMYGGGSRLREVRYGSEVERQLGFDGMMERSAEHDEDEEGEEDEEDEDTESEDDEDDSDSEDDWDAWDDGVR
ncbi:hypothetical protein M231_06236 [Tremella mesenterica]|uniref:SET domain-containing protein n=1 Tax=Tremella mesenterica TaxID=5217 RepID=A0A4Q1BEH9_TREME|nr:hypothetical protein M231_06236 [Tremella mesenterica]